MPILRGIFENNNSSNPGQDQSEPSRLPAHARGETPSRRLTYGTPSTPQTKGNGLDAITSGLETRQELIARIKNDQRQSWSQYAGRTPDPSFPLQTESNNPAPLHQHESSTCNNIENSNPNMERPRSALHAGDFREKPQLGLDTGDSFLHTHQPPQPVWTSTSPTDPWYTPSLPAPGLSPAFEPYPYHSHYPLPAQARSRAASQSSLSSSFVYRPPTSPLARGSQTTDHEDRVRSKSPSKSSRRRTFSPRSLRAVQQSPPPTFSSGIFGGRDVTPSRRDFGHSHQAHHPRRSVTHLPSLQTSSAAFSVSGPRARRQSLLLDGSPSQAPLVGGYEESILRGRMSTLPSRPLNFVAQIGVLGKGKCKSSLRCPPHVSIPFPAVFYNYASSIPHSLSTSDGPSPYVGMIDFQNLPDSQDPSAPRQHSRPDRPRSPDSDAETNCTENGTAACRNGDELEQNDHRPRRRHQSASSSRKAPQGGYRIPQRGQLQIVIKNPNKTAVKLFLIPYDLEGMEPGQKTFIRQRSYSAGPIIDMPLNCRKNLGTDRPEAALSTSTDPKDRPVLRYLIHLHICCPSRGRFYLHNSIRVVFANRVPDGKEKLRNEMQLPEPRYSPYRPDHDITSRTNGASDTISLPKRQEKPADFDPPTSKGLGIGYSFDSRLDIPSHLPNNEQSDQTISFHKKQVPAIGANSSINENGINRLFGQEAQGNQEQSGRPDSSGSSMDTESSGSLADHPTSHLFGRALMAARHSREQSPSPRNGLLSLQLRELERRDNLDAMASQEDAKPHS